MLICLILPLIQDVHLDNITTAISQGDLQTLSEYMDDTVEISVLEEGDIYVKKEALNKLNTFFAKAKPASFQPVHRGASQDKNSLYCIGNLLTKEHSFRVYLYIRVDQGQYFIQEIRFDKN